MPSGGGYETPRRCPTAPPARHLREVSTALKPTQQTVCFLGWIQAVATYLPAPTVAYDKTLRGSHDRPTGQASLLLVRARDGATQPVLRQPHLPAATNETRAPPALLETLALAGCLITVDAAGSSAAIAGQISDQRAGYLLALEANHSTLYSDVVRVFSYARAHGFAGIAHETREKVTKDHGQREQQ